jgi:predicted adenylyl cyclase CyaB
VTKSRTLYMLESTRIHLDSVEGLGNFLEFEYLISRDRPLEQAHEYLQELRKAFAMVIGEPVDCSYSDLIAAGMAGGREG